MCARRIASAKARAKTVLGHLKLKYVVEETQKFVSICKHEESITEEIVGEKGLKNIRSELG